MAKKIQVDSDQYDVMLAVADGARAEADYLSNNRPTFNDQDDPKATEALDLLDRAAENTPTFLNGVLLPTHAYNRLFNIIERLNEEVKRGKRYEAMTNHSLQSGQAMVGGILSSMLKRSTDKLRSACDGGEQ